MKKFKPDTVRRFRILQARERGEKHPDDAGGDVGLHVELGLKPWHPTISDADVRRGTWPDWITEEHSIRLYKHVTALRRALEAAVNN